ncbi:hypothetical protein GE09DRAFT_1179087 [Coniochaeta sp. 2T2.1]|nr:hypothetical protein GE09DRAFT_1179087 [Coniochaeta sp. 2T2.1]
MDRINGAPGSRGREMMKGTIESEKAVHALIPDNVPTPLAWGTYRSKPDMHFYMCDFVEMSDDLPGAGKFGAVLASPHKRSMGKSPNGMYGFPVTTHLAYVLLGTWTNTWTDWYSNAMKRMFEEEERSQGHDRELDELQSSLLGNVIPGLLGALETDGNHIQPCLCHSDVWPGNVKPHAQTGEVMLFDSCAF